MAIDKVFKEFRTSFLGKESPVHLFWGSFDLAVTRFSGRRAALHPGGIPALPDALAQESYDREVSSAGFWPGGNGLDYPAFYSYAYPAPRGFDKTQVRPDSAYWHPDLSEFILPYEAVRSADDPARLLTAFLVSTYEAAAELGQWDRDLLECPPGRPGLVRPVRSERLRARPSCRTKDVEREGTRQKGRYFMSVGGIEAEISYSRAGERLIIIDHTDVPAALRGRRVGERLASQAVEDARRDGVDILPLCPFATSQFDRHPEWQDVLRWPRNI